MSQKLADALTLRIERVIRAPRERVFDAWTEFNEMKRWLAPGPLTIPEGEIDLRVGGKYGATMVRPDGTRHVVRGVYKEITRPSRLVYTHAWVKDNGRSNELTPETVVTIDFFDEDGATRIVLTQTGFADKGSLEVHNDGWNSAFRNLEKFVGSTE